MKQPNGELPTEGNKMTDEGIYDLILDMVNDGKLVMKDGKIYALKYAPKEGVYIPRRQRYKKFCDKPTEGNK